MNKKIFESEYGESPLNFHVAKRGDELHVELTYPPWTDADNKNSQCRHIHIDQESVRASDGIRLHYDYVRDGFVVEQPKPYMVLEDGVYDCREEWIEVGFFKSWQFEVPDEEQMAAAESRANRKATNDDCTARPDR